MKKNLSEYLKREKAVARPRAVTIKRVNEIYVGVDKLFQNRNDEAVHGRTGRVVET